jgi:hypothetical protein
MMRQQQQQQQQQQKKSASFRGLVMAYGQAYAVEFCIYY